MNRGLIILILPALVAVSSGKGALKSDLRLISSSQSGVVLEYTPRFDEPTTVVEGNAVFEHWNFDGAIARSDVPPGNPELSFRLLQLILPGPSGHSVEILSAEYEVLSDVLLRPVARVEGEFESLRRTYATGDSYLSDAFTPSTIAEFRYTGVVRGYHTGEIYLSPLQYNPAARTMQKYTRIVVSVNFGAPAFQSRTSEDLLMKDASLNYSTARGWKAIPPSGGISRYRSSVFKEGTWYRFSITESGMYKLTGTSLLAAGVPSNVDPRTIKIYSNGGAEPPDNPTASYPDDVAEVRVVVVDGGTAGQLDGSDYLLFYGQGPSGWRYNASQRTFSHWINLFSNTANYWITYGGANARTMTSALTAVGSPDFSPARVLGKAFREDDRANVQSSGREWLGQSLNHNGTVTYQFSLPGVDPGMNVAYRFRLGTKDHLGYSYYDVTENESALITSRWFDVSGNPSVYATPFVRMATMEASTSGSVLQGSQSRLRFSYRSDSRNGIGYIDWIEIFYPRQLVADANVFHFHSHDTTATTSITVREFSQSPVWVFDVTKFDSVVRIVDPVLASGECTFQFVSTQGSVREFYMVGDNAFKSPGSLQPFPNQDVHGDTAGVDLVIITRREFLAAAQRLKEYRERPGPDRLTVRIVDVEKIYNEFSNGYVSPAGIRNYLRYLNVQYADSAPKYVLLFGDGDYDFRRINVPGTNWIPPWETHESFAGSPLATYATDDSIGIMGGSYRVQVAIGRLPVNSLAQANDVISKIIEYEGSITSDPWKMRLTYVADDGREEGTIYARDSEDMAENESHSPQLFEKQKIYSAEYPSVSTSAGTRRPAVNQAIVDAINRGTLVLNFIGHGNPRVWTHELVFVREDDFPRLRNKGKYFFLMAATCNYSQYDHPFDQSGGEQLVVRKDVGAIASISASRPVFHSPNIALAKTYYAYLFQRDSLDRIRNPRIGDAFFKTKQLHTGDNDKKFVLLGDPSLRFAIPQRNVEVDSLNGLPHRVTAQFRALDLTSIVGYVRETSSSRPTTDFSGTCLITVYDADRRVTVNKPAENFVMTYTAPGGVLFRGQSRVENGRLSSAFIVPKDISYDTSKPGRIALFFWSDSEDGAGVSRNIRVGGTNPNPMADSTGPQIHLYLDSRGFRPGDLVSDNPLLIVDLYDEHGINSSNIGIGHSIEMWVDGQSESADLSSYYRGEINSYQRGTIEYPLTGLSPGSHRIRLRAWDTYNNSSVAETNFDVKVAVGLQVRNVFNYPNPFTNSTVFTFQHNQLVPVNVEVKIYTVAGRLIESLKHTAFDMFVTIPWDGRDGDGDEISNGIYLYKLVVRTQDGRFASESLGKLSKVR